MPTEIPDWLRDPRGRAAFNAHPGDPKDPFANVEAAAMRAVVPKPRSSEEDQLLAPCPACKVEIGEHCRGDCPIQLAVATWAVEPGAIDTWELGPWWSGASGHRERGTNQVPQGDGRIQEIGPVYGAEMRRHPLDAENVPQGDFAWRLTAPLGKGCTGWAWIRGSLGDAQQTVRNALVRAGFPDAALTASDRAAARPMLRIETAADRRAREALEAAQRADETDIAAGRRPPRAP